MPPPFRIRPSYPEQVWGFCRGRVLYKVIVVSTRGILLWRSLGEGVEVVEGEAEALRVLVRVRVLVGVDESLSVEEAGEVVLEDVELKAPRMAVTVETEVAVACLSTRVNRVVRGASLERVM
jgi:hypothetical protein